VKPSASLTLVKPAAEDFIFNVFPWYPEDIWWVSWKKRTWTFHFSHMRISFSKLPPRVSMLCNTLSKYKTPRSFFYRVLTISNSSSLSLDAEEFESDNVPSKCSRVLEVGQGLNWILVNFYNPDCQIFHILIRTRETDWNLITGWKANIQPTLVSSFPLRCHVQYRHQLPCATSHSQ
jgi:hypothetical protein